VAVDVVDATGVPVGVDGRGLLTGRPDRVSLAGGPWARLAGWSAAWPVEERWWTLGRRRAARLQVVAEDGRAWLLVVERGRWRLEAVYG
jgi:protein ImuB